MKKYLIDLHVHTVLSPCADLLMTPGNILKKAVKEKIDIMAITDHNSGENLKVIMKMAENTPVKIIPGMEVETREEVHLLCLFPDLNKLFKWQNIVYEALPDKINQEDIFGPQIIVDEKDNYKAKLDKLLATAIDIRIEKVFEQVKALGGWVIPAHIDKTNGLIKNLGLIPENINIEVMEVFYKSDIKNIINKYPFLANKSLIKNSDCHYLKELKPRMKLELKSNHFHEIRKALTDRKEKIFLL
ncbi:MAG: PHP domain-containing protein [Halanaerobiales bacterium]